MTNISVIGMQLLKFQERTCNYKYFRGRQTHNYKNFRGRHVITKIFRSRLEITKNIRVAVGDGVALGGSARCFGWPSLGWGGSRGGSGWHLVGLVGACGGSWWLRGRGRWSSSLGLSGAQGRACLVPRAALAPCLKGGARKWGFEVETQGSGLVGLTIGVLRSGLRDQARWVQWGSEDGDWDRACWGSRWGSFGRSWGALFVSQEWASVGPAMARCGLLLRLMARGSSLVARGALDGSRDGAFGAQPGEKLPREMGN